MKLRQMIQRLTSNSLPNEQVTAINHCIFYGDVFRKPFSDLHPHLCKVSTVQFSWGLGCCKPPVGPRQSLEGGPGGKAPGNFENTVIYSTTKGSKISLSR